jgi:hypothetical protein
VITAIAGAAIAVGLVFSLHWLKLKEGISGGAKAPNISFQKLALFWVESEKEIFQIGVVAKFFNADEKPRLVKGLVFDGDSSALIPRGGSNIRRLTANEDHAELLEDNYMKGGDVAYFKKLFPVKFDMTILAGQPPEFILRGSWDLLLQDAKIAVAPALYSTYADAMSLKSWNDLLKPPSTVNVESFYYKAIPPAPPQNSTHQFYLVYNPDRSAVIEDPYVAQTPPVKTANGVMLFIGTQTVPPAGWQVLGRTYQDVWSDPEKLSLYNSLFPPDDKGLPRPFGFFAGRENEMAGSIGRVLSAPTTRDADIIDFSWSKMKAAKGSQN